MDHDFVATVSRGLEPVLAQELAELGIGGIRQERAAVRFSGPLAVGYRACVGSRLASRVLLEIAEVPAPDGDALYEGARQIPWQEHLGPRETLAIRFAGKNRKIRHPHYGALRVKDAICDALRDREGARPSIDRDDPDVQVQVHLRGGRAGLSIDLSGSPLHLRGRDRDGGPAPLRETLAAGLLLLSGWPSRGPQGALLVDPMCGSGTIVAEAVEILDGLSPGLRREHWGFSCWRGHHEPIWRDVLAEARDRARPAGPIQIFASDLDPAQVERTRDNLERAGLAGRVQIRQAALTEAEPPGSGRDELPHGLVVTNPPYGVRLGEEDEVLALWRTLGNVLRRRFLGWEGWILAGDPELAKGLGLRPRARHVIFNGPLEGRVLEVPISPRPVQRDVEPGDD
ncbi:MAG: hypothetical protein EA397_02505 [Deltaproteobacteria bacterium]|nr:MAG: hypothetical protein EA397_02505 [Deltaproteobacteria bacterium]